MKIEFIGKVKTNQGLTEIRKEVLTCKPYIVLTKEDLKYEKRIAKEKILKDGSFLLEFDWSIIEIEGWEKCSGHCIECNLCFV